jgi:hypothetical protein
MYIVAMIRRFVARWRWSDEDEENATEEERRYPGAMGDVSIQCFKSFVGV